VLVLVLVLLVAWWISDDPPARAAPAPAPTSEQPPPPTAPPVGQLYTIGGTGGPVANGVSCSEARARHRLVPPPPVVCAPGNDRGPA
jgi:hypothetical protein